MFIVDAHINIFKKFLTSQFGEMQLRVIRGLRYLGSAWC